MIFTYVLLNYTQYRGKELIITSYYIIMLHVII